MYDIYCILIYMPTKAWVSIFVLQYVYSGFWLVNSDGAAMITLLHVDPSSPKRAVKTCAMIDQNKQWLYWNMVFKKLEPFMFLNDVFVFYRKYISSQEWWLLR